MHLLALSYCMTPEDRVRAAAAARYVEQGDLVTSALAALRRRTASAGKTCVRCQVHLPFRAFGSDASKPDGFAPRCRRCRLRKS